MMIEEETMLIALFGLGKEIAHEEEVFSYLSGKERREGGKTRKVI